MNSYYSLIKNIFCLCLVLFLSTCTSESNTELLVLAPPEETGIDFNNEVPESDSLNILVHNYIYNGAGVGVGDFNKDDLPDLFFAGNLVDNRLYLNEGGLSFSDVSSTAQIEASGQWCSGVSIIDINLDGWEDIYVTTTFHDDSTLRKNLLFIHQGLNDEGNPVFEEQAATYGLADASYSTHSIFLDYDLDGDLDLFLLNNKLDIPKTSMLHRKITDGSSPSTDRLYRNNGNNTFTNVSDEAGITHHGFGLGVAVFDVNEDNYPDIYVSNDFVSNDIFWINNRDGTFTNRIMDYLDHQSSSSMGNNVGDLDNDGLAEIITLDMLPDEDTRMKMMFGGSNFYYYELMQQRGYEIQYPRNTIQWNQGNGHFSDIAMLLDIDATDWSWSPLLGDLDNNGWTDLFITNGFPRDITDLDFSDFHSGMNVLLSVNESLLNKIPAIKLENYLYLQEGPLQFKNIHSQASFSRPSFSNGAVLSDLDKDGDLDIVVSNINDPAFIYINQTDGAQNYCQLSLAGTKENPLAIGANVEVYSGGQSWFQEAQYNRGYCSTSEPILQFGLGTATKIDSLIITWPNQKVSKYTKLAVNQRYTYSIEEAREIPLTAQSEPITAVKFMQEENELTAYAHQFTKFYDFKLQPQLQKLASEDGPGLVVSDLNQDGLDDCILDFGENSPLQIFYQRQDGGFQQTQPEGIDAGGERTAILAIDINGDAYKDLYIARGAVQFIVDSLLWKDQVYINEQGQGFSKLESFDPALRISSCVVAADFDKDKDLDIFVGGRVSPGRWPEVPSSALYINEKGTLVNKTTSLSNGLEKVGMVTSALWTDYNRDDWVDLVVLGKWMKPRFFKNIKGEKLEEDNALNTAPLNGLWNSIVGADLDGDGYTDYILGNQGINNKYRLDADHPLQLYAKDFDQNGSIDPILSHYVNDQYKPYHLRNGLLKQLKFLSKDFTSYISYAQTTTPELLARLDTTNMLSFRADILHHVILWNEGGTAFSVDTLPFASQVSVGHGSLVSWLNPDEHPDILMIGNDYSTEVFNGINDAGTGVVIVNKGKRQLEAIPAVQSHFYNEGNTRSIVSYYDQQKQVTQFLVSRHGDTPVLHERTNQEILPIIQVPDQTARLIWKSKDGTERIQELYLGQGYLSQQSRTIEVPTTMGKVTAEAFTGERNVLYEVLQ